MPEGPPTNIRETIRKMMKDHNYDPFKEMILIAKSPDTSMSLRANMASELAQYIAPKLKGIDIDAKASGSIQVIVQHFADEIMKGDVPKTIDITPVLENNHKESEHVEDLSNSGKTLKKKKNE